MMDRAAINRALQRLAQDRSLEEVENFGGRAEARDRVAFVCQLATLRQDDQARQDAEALLARLDAGDQRFFQQLRADIRSTGYDSTALRTCLDRYTAYTSGAQGHRHVRYEILDELVAGLFLAEPVPAPATQPADEMVYYEPTPASVVLELVDRLALQADDVFYDLGSGLGQVTMLVHLLSGVQARGVEIEPLYCTYARRAATALGLHGVEFIGADARHTPLAAGTVFYLYTPFYGEILRSVLERLHKLARQRPIRIAAHGPCIRRVAQQRWLHRNDNGDPTDEFQLALFESR